MHNRPSDRWVPLLIVAAVLLTYSPLFTADFTNWDDPYTIVNNPRLRPPTLRGTLAYWAVFPPPDAKSESVVNHQYALWIPFTYTVWSGIAAVAQVPAVPGAPELNPYVFHAANVAVHAASAVIVWMLLRRAVNTAWPAAAGALLWAVHPVQVEPVAWVSGLKDLLAGLFSFAAILLYLRHTDESLGVSRRRSAWWLATLCFALAMLSKPSAVTTPLLAATFDLLILRRRLAPVLLATIPWLAMVTPIAFIARAAQPPLGEQQIADWLRPLIPADSLAFYLAKVFWPHPLCVDYGRTPETILRSGAIWWTWLVPACALGACLAAAWRGRRHPLAAMLIFSLAPLPVLGALQFHFQQFSTTADHYLYVAMLGPALLAASVSALPKGRWPQSAVTTLLMLILAATAFRRAGDWRDAATLFSREVQSNPASAVCLNNLAAATAERGDHATAAELFRRALRAKPDDLLAMKNLRQCLVQLRQYDEALQLVRTELKRNYVPWLNPNHLGMTLLARGRYDEAARHFAALVRIQPDDTDAQSLLVLSRALAARHPASTRGAPAP